MSSRFLHSVEAGFLLTVVIVIPAIAEQHQPLTDQQIASQVEHRVVEQDIRSVVVTVRDRTVTLNGTVPNVWAKEEAIEEAWKGQRR